MRLEDPSHCLNLKKKKILLLCIIFMVFIGINLINSISIENIKEFSIDIVNDYMLNSANLI
jgi:hypothetical protein